MTADLAPVGARLGRDEEAERGLSERDVLAFVEAWSRGTREEGLETYLGRTGPGW